MNIRRHRVVYSFEVSDWKVCMIIVYGKMNVRFINSFFRLRNEQIKTV